MPTAEAEQLDRAFHALADESRRAIVVRLSRGPASVSELAAMRANIDELQREVAELREAVRKLTEDLGAGS